MEVEARLPHVKVTTSNIIQFLYVFTLTASVGMHIFFQPILITDIYLLPVTDTKRQPIT